MRQNTAQSNAGGQPMHPHLNRGSERSHVHGAVRILCRTDSVNIAAHSAE